MSEENQANLYFIIDVEATDIKHGDPVAIGILRVDAATEKEIDSTILYCRLPENPTWKEFTDSEGNPDGGAASRNKYETYFKEGCKAAPEDGVIVQRIKELIPEGSRLCYFNCSDGDRLCLERRFPELQPLLDGCRTLDVATNMAWKIWFNDGLGTRSLEAIAKALGVPHHDLELHTPVDDCKLTHRVKLQVEKLLDIDQQLREAGLPCFTGKDGNQLVIPLDNETRQRLKAAIVKLTMPPPGPLQKTGVIDALGGAAHPSLPQAPNPSKESRTPTVVLTAEQKKRLFDHFDSAGNLLPQYDPLFCPICQKPMRMYAKDSPKVFLGCEGWADGSCACTCNFDGTKNHRDNHKKAGQLFIQSQLVQHRRTLLGFAGVPEDQWDC